MTLTVADLRSATAPTSAMVITQQVAVADADREKLVADASALPKSPSMQTLLDKLGAVLPLENDYRVSTANTMEPIGALERALSDLRQQVMAARLTTQDMILVAKIGSLTPTIDGVLDRFREVARHLNAIEDALSPLDQMRAEITGWAKDTGYTVTA